MLCDSQRQRQVLARRIGQELSKRLRKAAAFENLTECHEDSGHITPKFEGLS